jgi:hypothetical protein
MNNCKLTKQITVSLFFIVIAIFIIVLCEFTTPKTPSKPQIEVIEQVTPSVNIGEVWVLPDYDPFTSDNVIYEVEVKDIKGEYLQIQLTNDANVLISSRIDTFLRGWKRIR